MTAYELYKLGRLDEAIEAALQRVKAAPTALDDRLMLCDLLALDHQFERAARQLEVAGQQDVELAPGIALYRQLLQAAMTRRDVFQGLQSAQLLNDGSEVLQLHARASHALAEGRVEEASALLRQSEEQRPAVLGECDGEPFSEFRDLDDVSAPFLEVLTSAGKYYWIGWEQIDELEFRPPKSLRDLLWRQTAIVFRGGPDAVVYVPVLYPGTSSSHDAGMRLGRETTWVENATGVTVGIGQRTLLVGDSDKPLLSIGKLSFAPDGPVAAG
jgi:type VI secretion system protein ImpE